MRRSMRLCFLVAWCTPRVYAPSKQRAQDMQQCCPEPGLDSSISSCWNCWGWPRSEWIWSWSRRQCLVLWARWSPLFLPLVPFLRCAPAIVVDAIIIVILCSEAVASIAAMQSLKGHYCCGFGAQLKWQPSAVTLKRTIHQASGLSTTVIVAIVIGAMVLQFAHRLQMRALWTRQNVPPRLVLRLILSGLLLSVFLTYRLLFQLQQPECLNDAWHNFTGQLNAGVDKHGRDNVVLGIGQVIMDGWIVSMCIVWLVFMKNTRIGLSAGFFYGMRTAMMFIIGFPFPEHEVWHSPGWYSLTVPYDPTRDFYYSGHTGCLVVIMLEYVALRKHWVALGTLVCLMYIMNMLTIVRVHYTIDIAGGIVFALFMSRNTRKLVTFSDWLISQPYVWGMRVKKKWQERQRRRKQREDQGRETLLTESL